MIYYIIGYTFLEISFAWAMVKSAKNLYKTVKAKDTNYIGFSIFLIVLIIGLLLFHIQNTLWLIDFAKQ